jgi:hypothetical protein
MMSTFFVPTGKEIGDCWGTEHLQSSLEADVSESRITFEKRRHQKDQERADSAAPGRTEKPSSFRLLREQQSFGRSSW